MFGTLENHLNSISFLFFSHCRMLLLFVSQFKAYINAFLLHSLKVVIDTQLVNGAHGAGGQPQGHPLLGFRYKVSLLLKIR